MASRRKLPNLLWREESKSANHLINSLQILVQEAQHAISAEIAFELTSYVLGLNHADHLCHYIDIRSL